MNTKTSIDGIIGRPIRLNKRTLIPQDKNCVEVMFIGDVHHGSPQCDIERFHKNIFYCLKNGVYVFLMGDLTEVATRHSVGSGVYEQESPADRQHEDMVRWLRPLAQRQLIIGTHAGN